VPEEYAEPWREGKHLVRTACGSGRLNSNHREPPKPEINRPLPQAVLTEKGFSFPKPFINHRRQLA